MSLFDKGPKEPIIGSFKVFDKKVVCPNCGSDSFQLKDVLLNTPGMTFLGLDWANRTASALICTKCSRIEWYFNPPQLFNG